MVSILLFFACSVVLFGGLLTNVFCVLARISNVNGLKYEREE